MAVTDVYIYDDISYDDPSEGSHISCSFFWNISDISFNKFEITLSKKKKWNYFLGVSRKCYSRNYQK